MPHQVTVTVDQGKITCSPDPVRIQGSDMLLSFTLVTPGYAFPSSNAVVLKDSAVSDFPYPSWTVSSSVTALLDLNTAKNSYDYTVTVIDTSNGKPIILDPTIINEG